MRVLFIIFLILIAPQTLGKVHEHTLKNGLKILVKEDHRAPVAVSMVWYNVGSSDEPGGKTGLSHALEHMMFKGTPKNPAGVFSKKIAKIGGQENAFTNYDYTAYFEKLASKNLATSFELEADRMQNLILDAKEFAQEIKVIQEERRLRTDDNPQALTFERFLATAHLATPYHHPVIGWMSDLKQMNIAELKNWYERYYAPNNATLVVVGDVKPQQVFTLAQKYFGSIPSKPLPNRNKQIEPPRLGKKQVNVHRPAKIPLTMLGYTVPSVKSSTPKQEMDPYALELITGILDIDESGRFDQHLVRDKQLASSIGTYYNIYARYQPQFVIYGTPTKGHTLTELKAAIYEELKQLKTSKVPQKELQRIKNQIIAAKIFEKDSIFGQAMELGLLETVGLGWRSSDDYIEKIKQVSPEQIQQAAKRYFEKANETEARLIPTQQTEPKETR